MIIKFDFNEEIKINSAHIFYFDKNQLPKYNNLELTFKVKFRLNRSEPDKSANN